MTPKAGPGLFKRAVACVLMVTINISSLGQAVAQIIRGPNGAPLTGYTANGTYVQGGVVVGNPHQRLHDLTNPTLWTTGAVSFSNSTDPNFAQPTIDQMMSALAPPIDPGGLYLGRLYLNPTNPYTAGVGVLSTPPSPTPETGAIPPTGPLIDNHEHYARALAHAQANLGDRHADITRWSTTDPALGNGTAYLAKTHVDSSAELRNLHFDAAPGKPVFQATQSTTPGAVGYYAIQGEQAKTHLANIQQQNAALIGTSIFFSQQRLQMPSSTQASTDWEGNVHDPMAGFEASLGSAAQTQWGDPSFTVGYIRPDGQAHEFKLNDRHFQGFASQQGNGEWGASAEDLNRTLGQELGKAAVQHQAGQQAAANIDFGFFKEDRALFMQGMNLYQHVGKNDWYLLDGLKSGQITQGSADYERARELAQQAFRTAYAYHTEYQTQLKHTKESAAYQAKTVDLGRYSDQELFEQGLRLYDKRASERQEQLLRDLQAGRLTPGTPDYVEARTLAEARYRVALQKALEPPKKPNPFKTLVAVVVAAVAAWVIGPMVAQWASGFISGATATATVAVTPATIAAGTAGMTTTVVAGTAGTVATVGGVVATGIGTTVAGMTSAFLSTGIQTGSLSKALTASEKALKGGLVTTAIGTLVPGLNLTNELAQKAVQTVASAAGNTVAYGGDFGSNLFDTALNTGVDMVAAQAANIIGAETAVGSFEKYAAHAALGCGVGMVKSGSGDGCVPAATGAVAGHMAADGIKVALSNAAQDPANANPIALMAAAVPGRTLDDGVFFFGGIVGGTAAALAGGGQNVQGDFGLGQSTAENAIKNNYLKFDEAKRRAQLLEQCQSGQSCSPALIEELATLQALDKQRDQDLTAACGAASGGSRSSSACTVEYAKLEAARATFGPGLGMMDASDWLDTSSRDNIARTVQFLRWYEPSATDAANTVNRDRLTGVPLDEQGRYSARVMVGDAVFSPKYLPCATAECLRTGANLDMSDPGTQAYVRALDQQVFKDIGKGATIGTLVTPVGIPGAALGVTGAAAALGEAALSSNPISTGIDKGIETGSEKGAETFFRDVLGHSPGVAARAAALINLAGGWEAFRARVNTDLLGIPSNDQKK